MNSRTVTFHSNHAGNLLVSKQKPTLSWDCPGLQAGVELIGFKAFKGHADWSPVLSAAPVYKLS